MDHLIRYRWPGNVRELINSIERGVVLSRSKYLDESDLTIIQNSLEKPSKDLNDTKAAEDKIDGKASLEDVERKTILKTLESSSGNKSETARRLGITRKTLHKKLKKYGVMS